MSVKELYVCYLCARPATKPLKLKDSFTNHTSCRAPTSNHICDECEEVMLGKQKQLFYWNPNKNKWSKLFGRSLTRVYQSDELIAPKIDFNGHTEDKDSLPIVSDLVTREYLRHILLNPLEPPFRIVIAESGQKHILPWSKTAYSKEMFPVQFEMDTLYLKHGEFCELLQVFESLMEVFSKTEIYTGSYRNDRLMSFLSSDFDLFWTLENQVLPHRGSRLLDLINYVAKGKQDEPK